MLNMPGKYFFLVLLLGLKPALAEENTSIAKISVLPGYKSGNISYQIGGTINQGNITQKVHFPVSELEFPRHYATALAEIDASIGNKRRVLLQLESNVTNEAGKLIDKDWLTPNQLDIYSESDTSVTAHEYALEINQEYFSSDRLSGKLGLGAIYQQYKFKAFDTLQSYPSSSEPSIRVPGHVLSYDFSQIAPYLSLALINTVLPGISLEGKTIVSPLIFIEDKDQHHERDKKAESSAKGWLVQLTGKLNLAFSKAMGVNAELDYQIFEAEGIQTQTDPDYKSYTIEVKHIGEQFNFRAGVYYSF